MISGALYWITGLSGAGKSTIGNRLYYEIKKQRDDVVLLDGDILKNIFSDSPGYSLEARKERAMKYAKLCKSLTDQGLIVICCTIAMFDCVREWNRNNIEGYIEVFINTPMEIICERDQKGIYSGYEKSVLKCVAGKDVEVEMPRNPDIVIVNDNNNDLDKSVEILLNYSISGVRNARRDTQYWNAYYAKNSAPTEPSRFAKAVCKYLNPNKTLVELGCGNGRDSLFFAKEIDKLKVIAIDESDIVNKLQKNSNVWFVCDDFVNASLIKTSKFDYAYSRFTLHAINEKQQETLFQNIFNSLKIDGMLFIEARSINDRLFGKGKMVGKNAFIFNNHYRRFIDFDEICNELTDIGFIILYKEENTGFAPSKEDDPPIIRIICKK